MNTMVAVGRAFDMPVLDNWYEYKYNIIPTKSTAQTLQSRLS